MDLGEAAPHWHTPLPQITHGCVWPRIRQYCQDNVELFRPGQVLLWPFLQPLSSAVLEGALSNFIKTVHIMTAVSHAWQAYIMICSGGLRNVRSRIQGWRQMGSLRTLWAARRIRPAMLHNNCCWRMSSSTMQKRTAGCR